MARLLYSLRKIILVTSLLHQVSLEAREGDDVDDSEVPSESLETDRCVGQNVVLVGVLV